MGDGGEDGAGRRRTSCSRRSDLPYEPFPSFENGKLHVIDRMLDTNPFVAFGAVHARLPDADLAPRRCVNVTAGGGSTVPTFLIDEIEADE